MGRIDQGRIDLVGRMELARIDLLPHRHRLSVGRSEATERLSAQLCTTLIAREMHGTSNLICKNYELMKNKTFHFEHVRLNSTVRTII